MNPKIIYLDTNAWSMLTRSHNLEWLDVKQKLLNLEKQGKILVPYSQTVIDESSLLQDQIRKDKFLNFISLLSGNYHFIDGNFIKTHQLIRIFLWKHKGVPIEYGNVIEKNETLLFSKFSRCLRDAYQDSVHQIRQKIWYCEKDKNFENWYQEEIDASIRMLDDRIGKAEFLRFFQYGEVPINDEGVQYLALYSLGFDEDCITKTLQEYHDEIPFFVIRSALWASQAEIDRKSTEKNFPHKNKSFFNNDIEQISVFAYYADIVVIDSHMHNLINSSNFQKKAGNFFQGKIFFDCKKGSLKDFSEFLDTL